MVFSACGIQVLTDPLQIRRLIFSVPQSLVCNLGAHGLTLSIPFEMRAQNCANTETNLKYLTARDCELDVLYRLQKMSNPAVELDWQAKLERAFALLYTLSVLDGQMQSVSP